MRKKDVYNGRIINVRVYEGIKINKGPYGQKKTTSREIVEHPGAAAILAFDDDGRVIMVRQDRFPHGLTLEIPAGTLEEGESPRACAKRELEEETGYIAGRLSHLVSFYPSIGYSTEIIHCYVATRLRPAPDGQSPDDDESITIQKTSWKRLQSMVRTGRIQDSKTICSVLTFAATTTAATIATTKPNS